MNYKDIIEVRPGDIFYVDKSIWNNEQSYNIAFPLLDSKGILHMIDTYNLDRLDWSVEPKNEELSNIISRYERYLDPKYEYTDNRLNSVIYETYYKNECQVTKQNADKFKLICNLNNYRYCKYNEYSADYSNCDIIDNIFLYREQNWPDGITLIRRGSNTVSWRILRRLNDNLLDNTISPCCLVDEEDIQEVKKLILDIIKSHDINDINLKNKLLDTYRVIDLTTYISFLSKQYSEYCDYLNNTVSYMEKSESSDQIALHIIYMLDARIEEKNR